MPSVVSSSTSSGPGKTWYEYQDLGKSVVVDDRSGKLDRLSPAGYSKSDYDRSCSSQELKSEVTAHDRSGKPDKTVKSIPPNTENWLRKLYNYSMNNDTSNEDKHETNHINNKCNDMNTRNMHIT